MTDRNALIGHTGFVGSNLLSAGGYSDSFNSRNITEIRDQAFDRVVCAGVSAKKWIANREPEQDRASIAGLMGHLSTIRARRFILISTIDVFGSPLAVDEATPPERRGLHAYGLHRLELEDFVLQHFSNALVLRLPALFGPGLRKNIIYDLMHNNMLEAINPAAVFQWYPLQRLPEDIRLADATGLPLVHLAPEPLPTRSILERFFPDRKVGPTILPAPNYDLRTKYSASFGGSGTYILNQASVLTALEHFLSAEARAHE